MRGRTVILVSHHVALCAPGAAYVVALDNGRISFSGARADFMGSATMESLVQSKTHEAEDAEDPEHIADKQNEPNSETASTITTVAKPKDKSKGPRKLVEEEKRAVGRVGRDNWTYYLSAVGGTQYWLVFAVAHLLGALTPVVENMWLRYWSEDASESISRHSPSFYIGVYASVSTIKNPVRMSNLTSMQITGIGIILKTCRPLILCKYNDLCSEPGLISIHTRCWLSACITRTLRT